MFVFVLLSYIVVVAILKCLDVSKPSHRSNDNSEGMAKNSTGEKCMGTIHIVFHISAM